MKYKYFSYCPEDGFDTHETLEDALLNANGIIPNYLDEGWSEDVTGVFVGTITHAATMCDKVERAGEVDEYGYDTKGEHWDQGWEYKCNYKMLPVKSCEPIPAEGISERELFLCRGVMLDLAASDMKDLADGLMEFHFEDESGREGCFDVSIAEYAAKTAAILDSISANQSAPAFSDEDHVHIPRSLIHAACSAIDKKRDGVKTLAELRRYTTGDLSRQPAPDASKLVEALKRLVFAAQCRDNSTGDQIRLIETREELKAATENAEQALASYRRQGGDV